MSAAVAAVTTEAANQFHLNDNKQNVRESKGELGTGCHATRVIATAAATALPSSSS